MSNLKLPSNWVNPAFAKYGMAMAQAMTVWLYTDANAKYRNQPERWPDAGAVRVTQRTLSFSGPGAVGATLGTGILAGASQNQTMQFYGNRNFILFSRTGIVRSATAQLDQGFVDYAEQNQDGSSVCDVTSFANCMGSGEMPCIFPSPDFVLGNDNRICTVTNNLAVTIIKAEVSWQIAYLYDGR